MISRWICRRSWRKARPCMLLWGDEPGVVIVSVYKADIMDMCCVCHVTDGPGGPGARCARGWPRAGSRRRRRCPVCTKANRVENHVGHHPTTGQSGPSKCQYVCIYTRITCTPHTHLERPPVHVLLHDGHCPLRRVHVRIVERHQLRTSPTAAAAAAGGGRRGLLGQPPLQRLRPVRGGHHVARLVVRGRGGQGRLRVLKRGNTFVDGVRPTDRQASTDLSTTLPLSHYTPKRTKFA